MPESALEHVPVIDNSVRQDGTFARENFRYDHGTNTYAWPGREDPDHDRHAREWPSPPIERAPKDGG